MNVIVFAQVQPSTVPADPAEWGCYLIAVGISAAIGWGIEHWRKGKEIRKFVAETDKLNAEVKKLNAEVKKLNAEVKKLNAEVKKLNAEFKKIETEELKLWGDILKERQHARKIHTECCKRCSESASALVDLIHKKGSKQDIQSLREEFCSAVTEGVLPAYCSLVEWQALDRKNLPDKLVSFIHSDVIPELQRIRHWLQVINAPMFIDGYGQECLHIEERSMRAFFDLVRFIPEDKVSEIRDPLFQAIREVTGTGS